MKKFFTFFLALVASIGTMFASVTIDGITYNLNETTLSAEVTSGSNYSGSIVIPKSVMYNSKNYSVTSIRSNAFFQCSGLTSIEIPNSVTSIGNKAFSYCSSLTSIEIPNSVTSIGSTAFSYCSGLTSVTMPNSVTNIGQRAFYSCTSLTSLTIPSSVSSIGAEAFENVPNIVYDGVATGSPWGAKSINGFVDGYLVYSDEAKTNLLACSSAAMGEIIISNSVTSIGNSIFSGCTGLTSIEIPNSVTSIGTEAFYNCTGLTAIEIPSSVTSIGEDAFYKVPNIVYSGGATGSPWGAKSVNGYIDGYLVYRDETKGELLACSSSVTGEIIIPNSVWFIEGGTFLDCTHLTSVVVLSVLSDDHPYLDINIYGDDKDNVFANTLQAIYVPCGTIESYRNDDLMNWSYYASLIQYKPYSIQLLCDTQRGEIYRSPEIVDCDNIITAAAKYGYYFTQWSDGVTDNPRTIVLTQDTTFTAEFAPNNYSFIATYDEKYGTVEAENGDYPYLTELTMPVMPIYGYHFTQWSDGNKENPRTIVLTQDTTFTAEFAPNKYKITLTSDTTEGKVQGSGSFDYLTEKTVSATPNYGYHFTQWSDGNTDNPRTIELTQDTTFSAEFALNLSGLCGKDSVLTWVYEPENAVLTISGSGELTENYTFSLMAQNMKTLILSEGVTKIGKYAFRNSSNLTNVTLPNSLTEIGRMAFRGDSLLSSVTIPENVTSIGAAAFGECISLQTITIPENVSNLASGATFQNCTSLKSVVWNAINCTLSKGEDSQIYVPFIFADSITSFSFGPKVETIPQLLCANRAGLTEIIIPHSVTSIGEFAFYECTGLTSVTIGNSVTSIGKHAFMNCTGLTSVTIPNSVTNIGYAAFAGCIGLVSVTIGNSVTSIGEYAFDSCNNITSVVWNAVNCNSWNFGSQVTSFTFGENVEVIPASLCSGMNQLTEIIIPNSAKSIGDVAFYECTGLTSVTIPNSVTNIGEMAFYGCDSLDSITWNAKNCNDLSCKEWDYGIGVLVVLSTFPASVKSFVCGDEVERIPANICRSMNNIISIEIPSSVTSIGSSAFYGCEGLKEVTLNSNAIVGKDYSHSSLRLADIFGTQVETYHIGDDVTSIGNDAFWKCTGLTSMNIPNSVTSIGDGAFYGCSSLTSMNIPNSVTSIGDGAFYGCSSLTSITIPENITTIEPSTFANCTQLTTLIIPNSVTTIKASNAFGQLGAFEGCTNLQKIYNYGETPANVYSAAFDGVDKMRCTLYVPQGSIDMYKNAAVWRDFYYIEPLENIEAIEDVVDNNGATEGKTKILRDGQIYVLRGDKVYTLQGQEVR